MSYNVLLNQVNGKGLFQEQIKVDTEAQLVDHVNTNFSDSEIVSFKKIQILYTKNPNPIKGFEIGLRLGYKGGLKADLNTFTIAKDTEEQARQYVDKYCSGDELVFIKEVTLTDGKTLLSEIEEGVAYEVLADTDNSNSSVEITKQGERVQIYIKGLDFSDTIFIHNFIPSEIMKLGIEAKEYDSEWCDINNLTLDDIDLLGTLAYETHQGMVKLGERFKEVASIVRNDRKGE
ncbi:hypothetical protein ACQUY5_24220 [Bacillus cereus]|uniref:hypothetical protein n=1 Tax=Bacillus cereus TaxID=1396 RepID=UPI003D16D6BB